MGPSVGFRREVAQVAREFSLRNRFFDHGEGMNNMDLGEEENTQQQTIGKGGNEVAQYLNCPSGSHNNGCYGGHRVAK